MDKKDKNRTRKNYRWEIKTIKREQEVLRPIKKTVKRLVLEKQKMQRRVLTYKNKLVTETKTILKR